MNANARFPLPPAAMAMTGAPALRRLAPREREVAAIVYERTSVTARDVQDALSDALSNAAIRSMLKRLVAKGIIRVRKQKGHSRFLYSPAMLLADVRERALERTIDDFFDGSFGLASQQMISILERHDPRALGDLATYLQQKLDSVPGLARISHRSRCIGALNLK